MGTVRRKVIWLVLAYRVLAPESALRTRY